MHLGRFRVGDYLPLRLVVMDAGRTPAVPDAAPTAYLWKASGPTKLATLTLSVDETARTTGMFALPYLLDATFAAGNHVVVFKWAVAAVAQQRVAVFEIVAGGGSEGDVAAMHVLERPEGTWVLRQHGRGMVTAGRGPKVG